LLKLVVLEISLNWKAVDRIGALRIADLFYSCDNPDDPNDNNKDKDQIIRILIIIVRIRTR
jgi:hypothetical protein